MIADLFTTPDAMRKKWLGVRHKANGRDTQGVDCVGLIYGVYDTLGINLPGRFIYKSKDGAWLTAMMTLLRASFEKALQTKEVQAYDVLLFHLRGETDICHCGVCMDNDEFLHVLGDNGVSATLLSHWRPQLMNIFRLKGR